MSDGVERAKRGDYPRPAMIRSLCFTALVTAALAATPALAQVQLYPGQGISVNPYATGVTRGYSPQSGPYPGLVHLHMPVVHHHAPKPKPAANDVATTAAPPPASPPADAPTFATPLDSLSDAAPPAPAPVTPPKHHAHAQTAATPPPPAPDAGTGSDAALPLALDPQEARPVIPASPPHRERHAGNGDAARVASTEGPPATTSIVRAPSAPAGQNGLSKRSEILFPRGDPDVSPATVNKMRAVAADLTTLLGAGAQRVQLDAYGGPRGDKGSEARRLSLKRALGIRQLLIEDGIPSERIDVRAMGGIDDSGAPDRVDVFVRNG